MQNTVGFEELTTAWAAGELRAILGGAVAPTGQVAWMAVRRQDDRAEIAEIITAGGDRQADVAIELGGVGLEFGEPVFSGASGQAQPDAPVAVFAFGQPDLFERAATLKIHRDIAGPDGQLRVRADDPGFFAPVLVPRDLISVHHGMPQTHDGLILL